MRTLAVLLMTSCSGPAARAPAPPVIANAPVDASAPAVTGPGTVTGFVRIEGRSVPGALVILQPHASEISEPLPPAVSTRTSADGRYMFTNLAAITWQQLVEIPAASRGGYVFDVREKALHQADVDLRPAVRVEGVVLDSDGNAASDTRVYHPPFRDLGVDEVDQVVDPNGGFVLDHLDYGPHGWHSTYWVTARRGDGAVASHRLNMAEPGIKRVTLKLVPVTDPRVLRIVVVDAKGAPVPGAHVTLEGQPAKTDARGQTTMDYDSSITGPKNLTVRVNREDGRARAMTKTDVPRKTPLVITLSN